MKTFRKLTYATPHDYLAIGLQSKIEKEFPELKHLTREEMSTKISNLGLEYYCTNPVKVRPWVRITLPLALLAFLFMFIGLPFNFMITGSWGYSLKGGLGLKIYNWLKELKLI